MFIQKYENKQKRVASRHQPLKKRWRSRHRSYGLVLLLFRHLFVQPSFIQLKSIFRQYYPNKVGFVVPNVKGL
jgi:hypothetical protein